MGINKNFYDEINKMQDYFDKAMQSSSIEYIDDVISFYNASDLNLNTQDLTEIQHIIIEQMLSNEGGFTPNDINLIDSVSLRIKKFSYQIEQLYERVEHLVKQDEERMQSILERIDSGSNKKNRDEKVSFINKFAKLDDAQVASLPIESQTINGALTFFRDPEALERQNTKQTSIVPSQDEEQEGYNFK